MQNCPKCNIKIRGNKSCCPLCQGKVEGIPEDNAFKVIPEGKVSIVTFFRLCVFVFIIFEVGMLTTLYFSHGALAWPLIAAIWAAVGIVDIRIALYFKGNIIKLITVQTYIAIIITYIIDRLYSSYAFSVQWVNPAAFVALFIATVAIGTIAKLRIVDYAVYLLVDVLASLCQIVPIISGYNKFQYPAVISMGIMIVFGAFVLIFKRRDLVNATSKYLNI